MKRSYKRFTQEQAVEFDYKFPLYVDMGTRSTKNDKECEIKFGRCSRTEVVKALTPVAEAVSYKLDQMSFGWTTDIKGPMNLIFNYDVAEAVEMRWHPSFTFILQRNQGTVFFIIPMPNLYIAPIVLISK